MAPYTLWPVFVIGFGALYAALDRAQSKKAAFLYGWLWAFGYFVFGLYWIGNALLVEGNPYAWAWPLAVCGLPALLGFFTAFACVGIKQFCDLKHWLGYLGFVAFLALAEFLRGHLFTGFPWNLYGYSWGEWLPVLQILSVSDVYVLTALTVFWLSLGGFWLVSQSKIQKAILSALTLFSFIGNLYWGSEQMPHRIDVSETEIVIVQPNIAQHEKWQADRLVENFQTLLRLSRPDKDTGKTTLIVWPETAIAQGFLDDPIARRDIRDVLNAYRGAAFILTGALRYDPVESRYFNSVIAFEKGRSDYFNIYDKSHLVPFGEYIPFQKWIPLAPVAQFQGFETGAGPEVFTLSDTLSYSPLVCYEILFPDQSVPKGAAADFIVNVTNDAWYGKSPGPYQHFQMARFRAIENRTPVIRAANTGFSGLIDPWGRVLESSDLFETARVTSALPHSAAA
ncbi:MAG: apolipoprotein N-acyltransferase, partial [Bdellovibrionales bacterium]